MNDAFHVKVYCHSRIVRKTRKAGRKSPVESAASVPEGTIKGGWVTKKAANGTQRWVPETSVELNGFRKFTVDYAAKHIGSPITLYTREFKERWPSATAWSRKEDATHVVMQFVPNGDALAGTKRLAGWLKKQKPAIKDHILFFIDGPVSYMKGGSIADGMQVDSVGKKLVTTNFMNTETFVLADK
jgi:hypothetical protein